MKCDILINRYYNSVFSLFLKQTEKIQMIYSVLSVTLAQIYLTGCDTTCKSVLGSTFLINILISVIMLPINIRLAAQLVMQVFKYRYIVNNVATLDEDNKVMTGYYNHFRAVMCIILSLVGFNAFNIICSVHFLVYIFKSNWGDVFWYNWIAQGICSAFEESVILFAVSMLYQIACYFQGKKFRFRTIVIVTFIRLVYVSFREFMQSLLMKETSSTLGIGLPFLTTYLEYITLTLYGPYYLYIITLVLFVLGVVESVVRFPVLFSFVRVTQRTVNNYIKQFINDIATEYLDREHYVDKIRAGKLLQIAGWGTISVSFLDSLCIILQYILLLFSYPLIVKKLISLVGISIIQVGTILPSILYSVFIIILWLYFRYKTKVKYSGYNSNDPKVTKLVHEGRGDVWTNQDAFHYTFYKHKNKIFYITNVICVILISVIFAAFFAPLLSDKWKQVMFMKPGDYYLLDHTEFMNGCPTNQLDISVEESQLNQNESKYLNCSENIFAVEFSHPNQIQYKTYNYTSLEQSNYLYEDPLTRSQIWIPANSTLIASFKYAYYNNPEFLIKTDKPCYAIGGVNPFRYPSQLKQNKCQNLDFNPNIRGPIEYLSNCSNIDKTHINCTTVDSGTYDFYNFEDILLHQFGYEANDSSLTPLVKINGSMELEKSDAIVLQSSENIDKYGYLCRIQVTCHFNPAFRLLMPIVILLSSMVGLTLGIVLIHKI